MPQDVPTCGVASPCADGTKLSTRHRLTSEGAREYGRHGEEALELIGDESVEPFNLILSDIVMPKMTGHALKNSLQEMGIDVPFALMTGYDPDRTNFSENDSTPLLRKPFNLEELREILHSTLRD